jgi:F-type H+-transporting ATPase subunit b
VAEEAIAHLTQEKERILEETRQEQSRLMKEAAAERERVLEQAQIQAREEADRILQAASLRLQEEKEAAMKELRNEVAVISMAIAEKALRKELSSDKGQVELIDRLIDKMSDHSS